MEKLDASGKPRKGIEVSVEPAVCGHLATKPIEGWMTEFIAYRNGDILLHFYTTVYALMRAGF